MKEFLFPVIEKIQDLLYSYSSMEIKSDFFIYTLKEVDCKIDVKEISSDWGWVSRIHIKGNLPTNLSLKQSEMFSVIINTTEGKLKFDGAVSVVEWDCGEISRLGFTSCGPITLEGVEHDVPH